MNILLESYAQVHMNYATELLASLHVWVLHNPPMVGFQMHLTKVITTVTLDRDCYWLRT